MIAVDCAAENRAAEARIEGEAADLVRALASDEDLIDRMLDADSETVRALAWDLRDGTGEAPTLCGRAATLRDPDGPDGSGRSLLARAVDEMPRPVERDERGNGIIPQPFATVRDLRSEAGTPFGDLEDDALGLVSAEIPFPALPETSGSAVAVPSLPLVLYDTVLRSGSGTVSRGRGAPLALRLWVEALLSVRPGDRARGPTRLRIKLRDLIAALWPRDWSGPKRDGPRAQERAPELPQRRVAVGRGILGCRSRGQLPKHA